MHQIGVVGVETYFSVVHLMTRKRGDFTLFEHVSARIPRGEGDDVLIWQLNRSGIFDVRSFYNSLLKSPSVSFPWLSIWCIKVPKRVSFFLWSAAGDEILTIDNLVKKKLPLGVMRKLWITFYSIVSLLMLCGVRFSLCLGFSG